jgi:hypothetical protein
MVWSIDASVYFRGPVLLCLVWGLSRGAAAQSPLLELANSAREAKADYRSIQPDDALPAREKFSAATRNLDRLLAEQGENGAAWKRFLKWPQVEALQGDFDSIEGETFGAVIEALEADKPGLERREVAALRQAVYELGDFWLAVNDPVPVEDYNATLDRLAASLEQYAAAPTGATREQISLDVEWLRASRQALPLAERIAAQFNQPNLVAYVAPPVFEGVAGRKIDQVDPVRDNILDTEIYGVSRTIGGTSVELPDAGDRAVMALMLRATAYSDTVGYNGPVRIFSSGVTQLFGRAEILITGEGLVPGAVSARACTSNTTNCIDSRFNGILNRLVVGIARRRSRKLAPQANAIAASRAAARVRNQLIEEVAEQTAKSNKNLDDRVRFPLQRRDAFPARVNLVNVAGRLQVAVHQADRFQLGAASPAAPLGRSSPSTSGADLAVRLHESYVYNFASDYLANRTVMEADMRRDFPNLFKTEKAADEGASEDGEDEAGDMGITFAGLRPVTLQLDDGVLTLKIRGQEFFARGETFATPMNITVRYQVELLPRGAKFTMIGEPEVQSPDIEEGLRDQLYRDEINVRNIFQRRLARNLDREIVRETITLPGQLKSLGPMLITDLVADDGWLNLSLVRENPSASEVAGGSASRRRSVPAE